jgi:helicase
MDVSSIKGKVPNEIIESMLERGIREFMPPQELAIGRGLLSYKNIVVASPTGSGKTLIAEMACLNSILSKRRKAVYIAPMRALATEKFNEFQAAYPYVKTAISIGDLDSNDPQLADYSMLFFSTEKFDSLMRHGINWLDSIGCIVFDEVHMLEDPSRGPTLEILMTKLASVCDAQIVALSATIANCSEIAKWLGAELVESDYRPVKLVKGVVHDGRVYYHDDESGEVREEELMGTAEVPEVRITQDTLLKRKQVLLFYSARRNAEAGATRLSHTVREMLNKEERAELERVGDSVLGVLERPTEQCRKLAGLIKEGVAFHHAGLMNRQRNLIEEAFKANLLKAICATPTLALGVNLPAHTVVVRDTSRYENGSSERLGVNEVTQLFGRAGRPKYDKEGRALLIASTKERIEELYNSYIIAKLEPVESALGMAPVMRTHILAFVAQNFLNSKKAMQKFLAKSFYSFQYRNQSHIDSMIDGVVDDLLEWEFMEETGGAYRATKVGERVSQLYIDPLSAKWIVDSLERELDTVGILYTISNTLEMRPHVKATEEAELGYAAYMHASKSKATDGYMDMDYGYYDPVRAFSTALMLRDWMEEVKEPDIVKRYSTTPGGLYSKMTNADWLIYSAAELARILHRPARKIVEARVRLRYGIKEELLDLVRLEQIGRVRARMLYTNGIMGVQDIRGNREKVVRVLGKEIAGKVFEQLNM